MKINSVIYLYSEVMPYAIAVMRQLVKEYGATVDCVCWDEIKRTPFVPVNEDGIVFHKRSAFTKDSLTAFIRERKPSVIYVSGRMDKLYLEVISGIKGQFPVATGCDNQWDGSLKQKIGALFANRLYRRYFDYFWVPGPRQYEFARRMGYPHNAIINNLLTGDDALFSAVFEDNLKSKTIKFPHTFFFAGRLVPAKGIDILVKAFLAAKKELTCDWTLSLAGAGDLAPINEPGILVRGFIPTDQLAAETKLQGVFCLPSHREPWGVVIHEFAMAGMPIIASDQVGAADTLVINKYNGIIYPHDNVDALKNAMIGMMKASDAELLQMCRRSHDMSKMQSPLIAASSLASIAR